MAVNAVPSVRMRTKKARRSGLQNGGMEDACRKKA